MDEIQRLVMEVVGRDKIDQLNGALKSEQDALAKLAADLRTGAVAQAQFDQAATNAAGKILALNEQLKAFSGRGIGGGGILQASYAVQDFTSVLAGGQGLDRALSSVQNNIPGILMSLGASGGLAGVVSLVAVGIGALIPVVGKLWKSLESDAPEMAAERLKALQEQIKRTHEAFKKLAETPDSPEQESAEQARDFFAERPNAEAAKEAITRGMGKKSTDEALKAAGTRDEWGKLGPSAEMSDETIESRARDSVIQFGQTREQATAEHRELLQSDRRAAQKKRVDLEREAKDQAAEKMVVDAQQPGRAGARALRNLISRTKGTPGMEDLEAMTPESVAEGNREWEETEQQNEAIAASGRQAGNNLRRSIKTEKDNAAHFKRRKAQETHWLAQRTEEMIGSDDGVERAGAKEERDAPRERARQMVIGMSEQRGRETGGQEGGTPTAEQANQMADAALSSMNNGLSAQAAGWGAVAAKIGQIKAATGAFERQMAQQRNQQMGGDASGQFSAAFPGPG
jgi:hypothetical protein